MGVSNSSENGRSTAGRFGASEPQESGAGQPSFLWAGNRPKPVLAWREFGARKLTLNVRVDRRASALRRTA
jgi:hypothetical protein